MFLLRAVGFGPESEGLSGDVDIGLEEPAEEVAVE
jgi:hypothetical protein